MDACRKLEPKTCKALGHAAPLFGGFPRFTMCAYSNTNRVLTLHGSDATGDVR